jgi:SagB-type dehydrogenase family enzyme
MHELDDTTFPAWREGIARFEADAAAIAHEPRSYPGYPRFALPRPGRRLRSSLERALAARSSPRELDRELPSASVLGRIVWLAHGVRRDGGRGANPSAGGLQALELYVLVLATDGWLPPGRYHYDRVAHAFAQLAPELGVDLEVAVPAVVTVAGGALAWILAGDRARVAAKYGARADKFLLLEAGHLMQTLCLACADRGLATVPLGGFYERTLARALELPATDDVLYAGLCGRAR